MPDREKVIKDWESVLSRDPLDAPWDLIDETLALLKEQEEERRRLLSWLGKFCRHIDNGAKWLADEENIAFFKEKMKQQFGWDTD